MVAALGPGANRKIAAPQRGGYGEARWPKRGDAGRAKSSSWGDAWTSVRSPRNASQPPLYGAYHSLGIWCGIRRGGLTWKAKQTLVPLEGEWRRLL